MLLFVQDERWPMKSAQQPTPIMNKKGPDRLMSYATHKPQLEPGHVYTLTYYTYMCFERNDEF